MVNGPDQSPRILVVGRSPGVLLETLGILRGQGYSVDATNQFDRVLDDYDVARLDVLVFGGMVAPGTKQYLHEVVSERNAHITFVQGLAGIAGLIAAQVEGVLAVDAETAGRSQYDPQTRSVRVDLNGSAPVRVEAWWATSLLPPEPKSTSRLVLDRELPAGVHTIALPAEVPAEASFVTVAIGSSVRAFTVGAMPQRVRDLVPTATGGPLPPVAVVNTRGEGHQTGSAGPVRPR